MKNITLSMPEDLLRKSREYAKKQGTTLNSLVRELLRKYVQQGEQSGIEQFIQSTESLSLKTKGKDWKRDDLYDREILS
jgi:metal-responsive CopG/Arc/MetJ family transcriptional regulator